MSGQANCGKSYASLENRKVGPAFREERKKLGRAVAVLDWLQVGGSLLLLGSASWGESYA